MKSLFTRVVVVACAAVAALLPQVGRAQTWRLVPGVAREVAVSPDGAVWAIGASAAPGGFDILRWDGGSHWIAMPGGAVRVAADPNGNAWVANEAHAIWRYDGKQWVGVGGQAATDIGIGADGAIWVIGADAVPGGYAIYRSLDVGAHWTQIPGGAVRVAVGPQGDAWVVNSAHEIFSFDGSKFVREPGAAVDVSVGADGAVWIAGTDNGIYRWVNGAWVQKSGGAVQIAAGPAGVVWAVNAAGQIYKSEDTLARTAAAPAAASGATQAPTAPVQVTLQEPKQTTAPTVSLQLPTAPVQANVPGSSVTISKGVTIQGPLTTGSVSLTPGVATGTPLVVTGAPLSGPTTAISGSYECPVFAAASSAGGIFIAAPCSQFPNTKGPATRLGKTDNRGGCPSGFRDDGLYCAKPAAYGRGAGYAWELGDKAFDSSGQWARCRRDNSQGCEQPGGGVTLVYPKCKTNYYAFGTNICSPNCPSGMTDIGVSCTKPATCSSYARRAGLGSAFLDPIDGGTCWACPALMQRTVFAVNSTNPNAPACQANGIFWQSAQYPEPGLAAFTWLPDIVKLAFADPKFVDAFLMKRAGDDATKKAALWHQMITAPNDSAELKALLYSAILETAKNDPKGTTPAGQAVGVFQNYILARRTYIAQDALAMYNKYLAYNAYEENQGTQQAEGGGGLGGVLGVSPDDYVGAAYAAAVPDQRGQAFLSALADLAGTPYQPKGTANASDPLGSGSIAQTAASGVVEAGTSVKGALDLLQEFDVIGEIAALAGEVGNSLDLGGALVGQVLDAVSVSLTFVSQEQAQQQYATLVSTAQQPVSVAGIVSTGSQTDKNTLLMWWALATSAYQSSSTVQQQPMTNDAVCSDYLAGCQNLTSVIQSAAAAVGVK